MSGYNDLFLCEGCSLVSKNFDSVSIDVDTDCTCTCCWYQYIQNYCFRQLCSDESELKRLQTYTKEICSISPVRTTVKPYKGPIDQAEPGVELFSADNSTMYRSLFSQERKELYDVLGAVFDFDSLPRYEEIYKRNESPIEQDSSSRIEHLKKFEVYEKSNLEEDYPISKKEDQEENIFNDQIDDDNIEASGIDDYLVNEDSQNDDFYNEDEDFEDYERDYQFDNESGDIDGNDEGSLSFDKLSFDGPEDGENFEETGDDKRLKKVFEFNTVAYENGLTENPNDIADSEITIKTATFKTIGNEEEDLEGKQNKDKVLNEVPDLDYDKTESQYLTSHNKRPSKRSIDKNKVKNSFSEGLSSLREIQDNLNFELIQDLFESYIDTPNDFLLIVKAFLGEKNYKLFAGAYQESAERFGIQEIVEPSSATYCLDEASNFLNLNIATFQDGERAIEVSGCFMNAINTSLRHGYCPSTQHCSCKCSVAKGLIQCIETYGGTGPSIEEILVIGRNESDTYCQLAMQKDVSSSEGTVGISAAAPSEELIEHEFNSFTNLEPVARSFNFLNELAEIRAQYLWEASIADSRDSSFDIGAAIMLDKCELDNGELRDYLQFNLDSCDIRGLFYCKNHYKGKDCRPFQAEKNPCNNACCLQMKMVECAKSHCSSKKPVREFMAIANLVCTKHADPHITNGRPPYEEDELAISSSSSEGLTATSTKLNPPEGSETKDCGEREFSERPPPTRTDLSPEYSKRDENIEVKESDVHVEAQFKLGANDNDKIERLHNRICHIESFKPPYDTTGCEKREIKSCIKEGIMNVKNDPSHFCPYCVNDNAYDECRCACCFGKYFSKVCYDPNCKVLKEKLRYKRYVREVCRTKPKNKYKRELVSSEEYTDHDQGTNRFKIKSSKKLHPEGVEVKENLFDELENSRPYSNDYQEPDAVYREPVNLHRGLLNNMQVSSLRTQKIKGRSLYSDTNYSDNIRNAAHSEAPYIDSAFNPMPEMLENDVADSEVDIDEDYQYEYEDEDNDDNYKENDYDEGDDEYEDDGEVSSISKRSDKSSKKSFKERYLKAKAFAKKGSVANEGKKRLPSTFSPKDRKLKQETSQDLIADATGKMIEGRFKASSRKKKPTGSHRVDKERRARNSRKAKNRKLKGSHKKLDSKFAQSANRQFRGPEYFDETLDKNSKGSAGNLKSVKSSTKLQRTEVYKRNVLYKRNELLSNLDDILADDESFRTPLSTDNGVENATTLDLQNKAFETASKRYTTIRRTITTSKIVSDSSTTGNHLQPVSDAPITPVLFSSENASPTPSQPQFVIPSTSCEPSTSFSLSKQASSSTSITAPKLTITSSAASALDTSDVPVVMAGQHFGEFNVVTLEVPVTVTTIKTRYRPTTELYTEYLQTLTAVTTVYSDILTSTIAKKTLYRYKDITTTTESDTGTTTLTKVRTIGVPITTTTEYEESDKTVTKVVTTHDTITETWYEMISTATETSYSGTSTTTAYKKTKTKFKKEGTVTEIRTVTETLKKYRTQWYPEFTVTEYDEIFTTVKTKWYPSTTTDFSTTTSMTTSTTTTTSLAQCTPLVGRPTPPGFTFPFLIGRDVQDDQYELYTEVVEEVYEINPDGSFVDRIDEHEEIEGLEGKNNRKKLLLTALNSITADTLIQSTVPNTTPKLESSSHKPQSVSSITLFSLGVTVFLIGLSLYLAHPEEAPHPT